MPSKAFEILDWLESIGTPIPFEPDLKNWLARAPDDLIWSYLAYLETSKRSPFDPRILLVLIEHNRMMGLQVALERGLKKAARQDSSSSPSPSPSPSSSTFSSTRCEDLLQFALSKNSLDCLTLLLDHFTEFNDGRLLWAYYKQRYSPSNHRLRKLLPAFRTLESRGAPYRILKLNGQRVVSLSDYADLAELFLAEAVDEAELDDILGRFRSWLDPGMRVSFVKELMAELQRLETTEDGTRSAAIRLVKEKMQQRFNR